MRTLFLAGIAALFLATGAAHAMQIDVSRTWCARHAPGDDRETYYAWLDKCHKRKGTKARWMSSEEYWRDKK
jgi:hypothetical protein